MGSTVGMVAWVRRIERKSEYGGGTGGCRSNFPPMQSGARNVPTLLGAVKPTLQTLNLVWIRALYCSSATDVYWRNIFFCVQCLIVVIYSPECAIV